MRRRSLKTTVLVVEDDPALRALYRSALTIAGYGVVTVGDGLDALQYLESHDASVVVLDIANSLTRKRLSATTCAWGPQAECDQAQDSDHNPKTGGPEDRSPAVGLPALV